VKNEFVGLLSGGLLFGILFRRTTGFSILLDGGVARCAL